MNDPLYRPHLLDHARHPRQRGVAAGATHAGERANPRCGDRFRVTLRVEDGVVVSARFEGEGCALSTAAASLLLEASEDRLLSDFLATTNDEALALLGVTVSSGRRDCALLALCAARTALPIV